MTLEQLRRAKSCAK